MPTINDALTLADVGQLMLPNGSIELDIVDTLRTSGAFNEDGIWKAANAVNRHITPQIIQYPHNAEPRRSNRGVRVGKGKMGQIQDNISFNEVISVVDDNIIKQTPMGNRQAVRQAYDMAFIKGLAQQFRTACFYGDSSSTPEQPDGFATKRKSIGPQCLNSAGGGTKNTSFYLVGWDKTGGVFHIYPEGTPFGIRTKDMGKHILNDPNNTDTERLIPMWVTWFYLDYGLTVSNDRSLFRIANVNPEDTTETYAQKVFNLLNDAIRLLQVPRDSVRLYGSSAGLSFLDKMQTRLKNMQIFSKEVQRNVTWDFFSGIPLRLNEEISDSEAVVS